MLCLFDMLFFFVVCFIVCFAVQVYTHALLYMCMCTTRQTKGRRHTYACTIYIKSFQLLSEADCDVLATVVVMLLRTHMWVRCTRVHTCQVHICAMLMQYVDNWWPWCSSYSNCLSRCMYLLLGTITKSNVTYENMCHMHKCHVFMLIPASRACTTTLRRVITGEYRTK